jgi:hypothetical protein
LRLAMLATPRIPHFTLPDFKISPPEIRVAQLCRPELQGFVPVAGLAVFNFFASA